MLRHTFVVHVSPGGISTLENLATHELVQIFDLTGVGPQIDRWLTELRAPDPDPAGRPPETRRRP